MPEGNSTMAKALAWHTGGPSSNPDMTKVYGAPILLGAPAMCTLSLTLPVVLCSNVNTCHGGGKKRVIMGKILAVPSVRQNTDVWEKGGKNVCSGISLPPYFCDSVKSSVPTDATAWAVAGPATASTEAPATLSMDPAPARTGGLAGSATRGPAWTQRPTGRSVPSSVRATRTTLTCETFF